VKFVVDFPLALPVSLHYQNKIIKLIKLKEFIMKPIYVFLVALFTSLNVFAVNNSFTYLVNADKDKVMVINLNKAIGSKVEVSILNKEGDIVFNEKFKAKSKLRKYNLRKLNVGTYTVIVEDNNKVAYQKIHLSKNSLLVDNGIDEIYKPVIKTEGNLWTVSGLANQPVSIVIEDAYGNLLTSANIASSDVQKKFNVKNLIAGEYKLIYKIADREFINSIVKK
jgi:hypothetical protein